ncbi:phosphate transport system permease protein [Streptosporangium becharense]|uniref:Phosphate transport system permease protein n=1 Tax=Streptosporangium becharense TaxID=1816182 RepID=A0A7W9MHT4_9ACTN|nr:phosphate ABC transporter permease subunit PstC [Streptosporangium becharense]MBB2915525.1 phosphate transport system permease protein [Streptosporangium becharense]MBB5821275.1 phosphate transport system permease protein [Streptosporangium becharense]
MSVKQSTTASGAARSLARSRPRYGEVAVKVVLLAAALVSVATTIGIVFALVEPTIEFFGSVSIAEFFGSTSWGPLFNPPAFGVWPLIVATLEITLIAVVVAVPLGLAAAIYLSEYASARTRKIFKPVLEVLAGVPTVVFGFFALTFVTPLLRDLLPFLNLEAKNALSAGLLVGVMIIPIVASLSEDAMAAVPNGLREGSYALGASKMITSVRVVVPAAFSGIVAAVILAISRAAGETMIVAIAGGFKSVFTLYPGDEMATMAAFIAQAGSGDASVGSIAYKTIFAVGSLLFVLTFAMNYLSARMVQKYREVYD